jgi:hypothetical protein
MTKRCALKPRENENLNKEKAQYVEGAVWRRSSYSSRYGSDYEITGQPINHQGGKAEAKAHTHGAKFHVARITSDNARSNTDLTHGLCF